MISQDTRVPGSLSTQRRPAPPPSRALLRSSDRRSDSAPPVLPGSPRASSPTSGARASNAAPLTLGTRAGEINAPLPNHAPHGTTRVAPSRRSFQRECPLLSPPGHAVAVGLRCGKANTETPRSRLKLDSAFPRNNDGCPILFPIEEESTRLATSSPFPTRSTGRKPSPVDPLLPPTGAPFLKSSTGSAGPLSSSRTPLHVRRAPSAPVEQEKPGTARRASGDSTASGQINRTAYPLNSEESQLSSSRTGSEPPAPFGPGQRSSGAVREPSGDFLPTGNGDTEPVYVEPDSPRAPGAQCSQRSTLAPPHTATAVTDDSTYSVFDPTLEYSTERVVLFWQPPSYFSQWSPSVFVIDEVTYSCAEQYMMAEKARLFLDHDTAERIMASPDPREQKRLGRGVHNFDCATWDRVREDAVLTGYFPKFT